jgi:putative ABC transport system permease protein
VNIIGVIKDFHFKSFKEKIEPLIVVLDPKLSMYDEIGIRYSTEDTNVSTLLAEIMSQWKGALPHLPFEYSFLDQEYDKYYKAEHRLAEIFEWVAFLAILISALGLFGLSLLSIDGSKREISIRKILGASGLNIAVKFVRDYTLLVVLGVFVAVPVTWFILKEWLNGFAYRVDIGMLTFGASVAIMLIVCWSTIAYHVRKATLINPVDNLKEE